MKQINRYLKQARMHPEILSKLTENVSRNQELRQKRRAIEEEMRETRELILQAKNELDQAIADREMKLIMKEQSGRLEEEIQEVLNTQFVMDKSM